MADPLMAGYRNLVLGVGYLALCAWLAWLGPTRIPDLAAVYASLGVGVTGIIAARAANKWASSGSPPP